MQEEINAAQKLIDTIVNFFVNYSFQVVGAIIILVIGILVARAVSSFLLRFFERKEFDVTLSRFITAAAKGTILGFAILVALGKFGITIAPFIAALAAMAFGASFAIQGPLANYGAGLVIIVTRPFVVGNTIRVSGVSGIVDEVNLGATILKDEDGVKITIPNKHIVGEILHNSEERRIVEEVVGISYDSDPENAIQAIKEVLDAFQEITKEPPPQVGIQEFGDSSINIGLRYWIPTKIYFKILYQVNLAVYKQLKARDIEIPFPQRDVHIVSRSQDGLLPNS
ncbi:MAG: mechanosensitive ion channel family protein [Desulfobacteraceae bacterium]|nr:mechanosensitive ion channel family protein [Desulfobacteraceae bacterium]MDH3572127.1 mechanosensitive ion channel family protein [Desulfobacteraceae bacterium]MDH3720442.1 mechanosensitive ion channel family protein [Desulfobacteraceae bacterium]MDH3835144.1 mechanosensitive ion channel family protein [Desulfobacteraceae bacterium]MDH3872514.1 mechanosensitive ion channel family protein [Desulfobacteraceae bacterium]